MNIRLNIKEAKQEVINTVRAYLKKDDTGAYEIPPERQRPILLMGPPGIGTKPLSWSRWRGSAGSA